MVFGSTNASILIADTRKDLRNWFIHNTAGSSNSIAEFQDFKKKGRFDDHNLKNLNPLSGHNKESDEYKEDIERDTTIFEDPFKCSKNVLSTYSEETHSINFYKNQSTLKSLELRYSLKGSVGESFLGEYNSKTLQPEAVGSSATTLKYEEQSTILKEKTSEAQPKGKISIRETGEFGAKLDESFPKAYKPAIIEKGVYQVWEENGYFTPKKSNGEKFSMVLPPPNVTGTLHLGHAITLTIQDALARWHRMEGKDVLWVPGLDHAGIATQTVVEKWLRKHKKLTRAELGRDKFVKEVMLWKEEKADVILQQLRKMGASLDWSREIFTMDQRHNDAVVEAIVRLWNAGLVYRKEKLINWSCDLSSAISDIEVERLEITGPTPVSVPGYNKPVMFGELVEIVYKVFESDEEIVVATTRPETMLGDVAVAVHPEDKRYTHLIGRTVWHPFRCTPIPIVADEAVDMNFGSGAVKVTPGHSPTDWDIAERHNLPKLSIINNNGCISTVDCGDTFEGMKRFDAREAVKKELAKLKLLKGVSPHNMQVPICSRSGDVVEYMLKHQWFISCKTMAEKASTALRAGLLQIEPPNYHNTWFTFLDNIRDWCISRQLWWGHRIPMYLATAGQSTVWVAAPSHAEAMAKAKAELGQWPDTVVQDPDVLDTWFSSALYPLSALGWPKQTEDLQRYYPLSLMETGHDILFFWVARMVMLGVELTGELPFKKVLLHGIVCDAMGRKMSKSLGNVVHPEDVIHGKSLEDLRIAIVNNHKAGLMSTKEKDIALQGQQKLFPTGIPECGTDALRFTLLSHKTKNHLISFDVRECETNHHFMNKIWQASRFSLHWATILGVDSTSEPQTPSMTDRWILSQLGHTVDTVTAGLKSADFHQVTAAIKDFLYYKLCDYYVEAAKPVLKEGTDSEAVNTCQTLAYCLDISLRLASPIMPFISEQLFKHLPGRQDQSCMLAAFPSQDETAKWRDSELDRTVQLGIDVLCAVRTLKSSNGFYKKHVPVEIETNKADEINTLRRFIEVLANCSIQITERTGEVRKQMVTNTVDDHSLVHISLTNMSKEQHEEYYKTLMKKEAKIKKALDKIYARNKQSSLKKANKEIQDKIEEQVRTLEEELNSVQAYMEANKPT